MSKITKAESAFDKIRQGLEEAYAFAKGDKSAARVRNIEVPTIDVAELRNKIGYSQNEFAKSIGVSKGTLLGWEQGRRRPTGAARVLLGMIDKRPSIVQELLSV